MLVSVEDHCVLASVEDHCVLGSVEDHIVYCTCLCVCVPVCVCLGNGRVFTWGLGTDGQLGNIEQKGKYVRVT